MEIYGWKLRAGVVLKEVTLETLSQEAVIGLMGVSVMNLPRPPVEPPFGPPVATDRKTIQINRPAGKDSRTFRLFGITRRSGIGKP